MDRQQQAMSGQKDEKDALLDAEPTTRDLANQVAPKVGGKLKFLALELGLAEYDNDRIARNNPYDAQGQALGILTEWKNKDKNVTWRFLIEALRAPSVNLSVVANEVEQWVKDPNNIN